MRLKPVSEIELRVPEQLVRFAEDGAFEFVHEGEMVYDCEPRSAGQALRWIEHLAQKTWITCEHLEQFARLAATRFGEGHI